LAGKGGEIMADHPHGGHRQRLKTRYLLEGLDHFSPHEVLELLLTFAIPQRDVNPLAHALIDHFGSLRSVMAATQEELREVPGVGEHTAALIRLMYDVPRYVAIAGSDKPVILKSSVVSGRFFIEYLRNEPYECFAIACVRSDYSLVRVQKLNRGNLVETSVFLRAVVELAFRQRAYGVLIAHNHPSGACEPSPHDIETTESLRDAFALLDIRLLDHLIVTQTKSFSIYSNRLVEPISQHASASIADSAFELDQKVEKPQ
jgi:DNA repair protein RadC